MPSIGVIDDRTDVRQTIAVSLGNVLPDSWEVIEADPLTQLAYYPSWLGENEIVALLIDERLNEVAVKGEDAVAYYGHDLVRFLRTRMVELPIFVVTSHANDLGLIASFGEVEDIIDRLVFLRSPEKYAPRFIRASQRYLESFTNDLSDLSSIAVKAAAGIEVSQSERARARAIQQKIDITFSISDIEDRSQWVSRIEETIEGLDKLKQEVAAYIQKADDNEMDESP